jgi:hypothetical protein
VKQKALLGVGFVALLLGGLFAGYWFGRSSSTSTIETPPSLPTVAPAVSEAIEIEPLLKPGARIEALSSEGWQAATITAVEGDQVSIRYAHEVLGEERIDVRLIRKPESELVAKAAPVAETKTPPPSTATTPPAPPLGPRATASKIPTGDYVCEFDNKGAVKDPLTDEDGAPIQVTLTIEIVSARVYRAFNGEDDDYNYEPASGRITWENGMLAQDKTGQYRADSQSIVTTVLGKLLTCTLRR